MKIRKFKHRLNQNESWWEFSQLSCLGQTRTKVDESWLDITTYSIVKTLANETRTRVDESLKLNTSRGFTITVIRDALPFNVVISL
jgi:hypothetical protein